MEKKITRKQLQEKFFGIKNNEIIKIQQDISDVFYLFEELKQHVEIQEPIISQIDETIQSSQTSIDSTDEKILQKLPMYDRIRHFYYAFIGGSMASVVLLYNPYIGIGAISTGLIAGSLFSYFKK
jgi:hypothetical protein